MFHATLEELQALAVTPVEIESAGIAELLQTADYEKRIAELPKIPDCLILADPLRLQQVFDNIIYNSYKYAGTEIFLSAKIEENFLMMEIKDQGKGVAEDELPLVFNKFYRGKNAEKHDGYGLGLFISKYFMQQMHGDIFCRNNEGFAILIKLKLAD
jgi:signal transduction histidine kinase